MPEAVVLGVGGVLQPLAALWSAEIDAAVRWLEARGIQATGLRREAAARRLAPRPAPLGRTLRALAPQLDEPAARELLRTARTAVPEPPPASPRPALLRVARSHRLAFLDHGDGPRFDAWMARLGVADLGERRLWTGDLGHSASPPAPLAFRWLSARLDVPPARCLYVGGTDELRSAARGAGWRVWGTVPPGPSSVVDLEDLGDALDSTPDEV
jgi:FMN phosphatase YigB (HAD superfamily)